MAYLKDPGEQFASDTHRRVLGSLTTPDDQYGWSLPALFERMRPDVGTDLQHHEELASVLGELEQDGHAQRIPINGTDVWKMTPDGFELLTGPIANEPAPGAAVIGPAVINAPGVAAATRLDGGEGPAGDEQGLSEAENTEFNEEGPPPGSPGPAEGSTAVPPPANSQEGV